MSEQIVTYCDADLCKASSSVQYPWIRADHRTGRCQNVPGSEHDWRGP